MAPEGPPAIPVEPLATLDSGDSGGTAARVIFDPTAPRIPPGSQPRRVTWLVIGTLQLTETLPAWSELC